ncbi:MAG: small multi-drug export protein [Ruminococcaceae bacterium]|nr:small multi-drug export protein [Oscillospiraceae bacterium]
MKNKLLLIVFLCSMIPIVELRGAIPLGAGISEIEWVSELFNIGSEHALPWWLNYITCVIGNMLPIPFILIFIKSVLNFMRRGPKFFARIALWLDSKVQKHAAKFEKSQFIALLIFVGIPIPGTGAWTGALIAAILGMRIRRSLPAIFLGVLLAGTIMTVASYALTNILNFLI